MQIIIKLWDIVKVWFVVLGVVGKNDFFKNAVFPKNISGMSYVAAMFVMIMPLEDAFYSIQKYSRYTKYNNTWKYPYDKEKLEDWLNRAFNNVKLFGTEEMIERIDILYNDITNKSTNIDLDVTLCYLCSKIRLELGLPKIQKEIVFPWLLINNCDKKNNELQNN